MTNCCQLVPAAYPPAERIDKAFIPGPSYGVSQPAAWSCRRWGLPCQRRHRRCGALLPHLFTFTCAPLLSCPCLRRGKLVPAEAGSKKGVIGCVFSVALSLRLPSVAVSHHHALSCSDFPPPLLRFCPLPRLASGDAGASEAKRRGRPPDPLSINYLILTIDYCPLLPVRIIPYTCEE